MGFWTWTVAEPTRSAAVARLAEAQGWDGIGVGDSQSLTGDPYVALALAATATDRLRLATSVTNPVTRHAAVTASSAFALQHLSRGRMAVGIGRGDSALAHLGRAPARLGWFETYVEQLQAYLCGAEVPFGDFGIPDEAAGPSGRLGFANAPQASAIRWPAGGAKVPVEVAATGPRVIGIAARHADRVMLAVGADPKRIAWGVETARAAASAAGRDGPFHGTGIAPAEGLGRPLSGVWIDGADVKRAFGRLPSSGGYEKACSGLGRKVLERHVRVGGGDGTRPGELGCQVSADICVATRLEGAWRSGEGLFAVP